MHPNKKYIYGMRILGLRLGCLFLWNANMDCWRKSILILFSRSRPWQKLRWSAGWVFAIIQACTHVGTHTHTHTSFH